MTDYKAKTAKMTEAQKRIIRDVPNCVKAKKVIYEVIQDIENNYPMDTRYNEVANYIISNMFNIEYNLNGFNYNTDRVYLFEKDILVIIDDWYKVTITDWRDNI